MKLTVRNKPIPQHQFNSCGLYALAENERRKEMEVELTNMVHDLVSKEIKYGRN